MELKAVLLNCTLKKSPAPSHTQGLIDIVIGHLHDLGVSTEAIRPVDYNIPFGVDSDLGNGDEWPYVPPTRKGHLCRTPTDVVGGEAGDRLRRRVPEADHALRVDQKDTVADV